MVIRSSINNVFQALSDPTRRDILEQLAAGERPVMSLVRTFSVSQPAITKHLNVLERAGLIERRAIGRERVCRLCPNAMDEPRRWMEQCREYWNARLDAVEAFLASKHSSPDSSEALNGVVPTAD